MTGHSMQHSSHCHCGSSNFERFSDHSQGYYDRCTQCRSLRYGPTPTQAEIEDFYANYAAYKSGLTEYLSGDDYDIFISTKKLTMLDLETPLSFFEGKRYLDIGCGTGHWLRYLAENGLVNGFGIDASLECVAIGQKYGVEIRQTDFMDVQDRFDVLFMSHLIEHVPDPEAYIAHCATLLSVGGSLMIETPVTGPVSEAYGSLWRFLMPVEHLNLFSINALKALLHKHGFEMVKDITFGSGINSMDGNHNDKRAMDRMAKRLGIGDTYAGHFIKK